MNEQQALQAKVDALETQIRQHTEEMGRIADASRRIVENALTEANVAAALRKKLAQVYPLLQAADQFIQGLESGMDVMALRERYYLEKVTFDGLPK